MCFEVGERVAGGKVGGLLAELVPGHVQRGRLVELGGPGELGGRNVFLGNLVPVARQVAREVDLLLGNLDGRGGLGGNFEGLELVCLNICFCF